MEDSIAFVRGIPPAECFPKKKLVECAQIAILKYGDETLQYANSVGFNPLREWVANKHDINGDRVTLGQGSLQLLDFFIRSSLSSGDLVFFEQPTYDRVLILFRRAGMQLKGFNLKDGFIDIDEVEDTLKKGVVPRVFYIIPDFQNPSGALMPLVQRKRLLDLAYRYQFMIIEDGPYRHLRYSGDPVPAFFEQDQTQVIHMSSFSKLISPGLRVGYIITPDDFTARIRKYAEDSYINSSYLNQAIVYEFIRNGWLEGHIESLLALFGIRLNAILESLRIYMSEKGKWIQPQGGFFVGLNLDESKRFPDAQTCKSAGIALSDSTGFFLNGGERFIRLPFCALTPEEIQTGIQRLAEVI